MIYREDENLLHLAIGEDEEKVTLEVNCVHGSMAKVSYHFNGIQTTSCGETSVVGLESELPSPGSRVYIGKGGNPDDGTFKVEHIFRSSVASLTYVFPDDYQGEPDFDNEDETPTYRFKVNFKRPETDD